MRGAAWIDYRSLRDLVGGAVAGAVLVTPGASPVLPLGGGRFAGAVLASPGASIVPSPGVDVFLAGGVNAGANSCQT